MRTLTGAHLVHQGLIANRYLPASRLTATGQAEPLQPAAATLSSRPYAKTRGKGLLRTVPATTATAKASCQHRPV